MDSSNLIKIIGAFVAGVVVTLGGALIYVKSAEMMHSQQAAENPAAVREVSQQHVAIEPEAPAVTGQDATDQATQTPSAQDEEQTPEQPQPTQKKHRLDARSTPKHRTKTTEIAQNIPPANTPDPAAAGSGGQQNVAPAPTPSEPQNARVQPQDVPDQKLPAQPQTASDQQNQPPQSTAAPVPAPRQPHTVTLAAGTNVVVRLAETLSTDHNYTGDTFRATLESPVIVDGFIIADKGSKVLGKIVNAQKAGRLQGVADLNLVLTEINTTDGQRVKIDTSTWDKKGPKNTGQETAKIAGGAAIGAIIGAMAGGGKGAAIGAGAGGAAGTGVAAATRGNALTMPIETRLTFRLAKPITITEKLNS